MYIREVGIGGMRRKALHGAPWTQKDMDGKHLWTHQEAKKWGMSFSDQVAWHEQKLDTLDKLDWMEQGSGEFGEDVEEI